MKTVWHIVDFFPDLRYKILLETWLHYPNVWLHKDGRITICLTEDDIKTLKELPRLYYDVDSLNKEFLFMREKKRLLGNRDMKK